MDTNYIKNLTVGDVSVVKTVNGLILKEKKRFAHIDERNFDYFCALKHGWSLDCASSNGNVYIKRMSEKF